MSAPKPFLTYLFWGSSHTYHRGGDVALANVNEVSASVTSNGSLRVIVTGRMLKKDGTPGMHSRGSAVDLTQPQPDWLTEIIDDAAARLANGSAS